MSLTIAQLASELSLDFRGQGGGELTHVASLHQASEGSLSFLAGAQFLPQLATTQATVVIVRPEHVDDCPSDALISDNPYLSYAQAAQLIYPLAKITPGIAGSAVVGENCQIAASAMIEPLVVVGDGVEIGERVVIGAGSVIGDNVAIGDDSRLDARVVLYYSVRLGERCRIASGAVLGADGFGFANHDGAWVKIPQVGSVTLGNDVEIGANTTIDRGAIDDTMIGNGVIIDNQVQIAHNVSIGDHTAIAGCAGIAGSARIGKYCSIGGSANIVGHLTIADHTTITAQTFVTRSISTAGVYSSGVPMQENRAWRRNYARFKQLDELSKRVSRLEKPKG